MPLAPVPELLKGYVSEQQLTLLAAINQSKRIPDGLSKQDARQELLRALQGAERALSPARDTEIIAGLTALAEAFQVTLPGNTGLDLYVMALKDISGPAFKRAIGVLVKDHKWPRLPFPADIREACETGTLILRSHLTRIERAMTTLEALP